MPLQEAGERVDLLVLLDAFPPSGDGSARGGRPLTAVLRTAGADRTGERTRGNVLAALRRESGPPAGLDGRTPSRTVGTVPRHEHRRCERDVLSFNTAPRAADRPPRPGLHACAADAEEQPGVVAAAVSARLEDLAG